MQILDKAMSSLLPRLLAGKQASQRLSILLYHRVLPEADFLRPMTPTAAEFDWQMQLLRRNFSPLTLADAMHKLDRGELPPRAVCVTFDDGYADNLHTALPILQRHQIPASLFVSTSYLESGLMWNDALLEAVRNLPGEELDLRDRGDKQYPIGSLAQRRNSAFALLNYAKYLGQEERAEFVSSLSLKAQQGPIRLMLDVEELRSLTGSLLSVGAHTHTHPILAQLPDSAARLEIAGSKRRLEEIMDHDIDYFAYPNGIPNKDFGAQHKQMVREAGFSAALATQWGVSDANSDRWQLPRFTPWDKSPRKFLLRLLLNLKQLG